MWIQHSKSLGDLRKEESIREVNETAMARRQRRQASGLNRAPRRRQCVLCNASLRSASSWQHRDIWFLQCHNCGQIQSRATPPRRTPFAAVYPTLSPSAYHDRKERIYRPKLDWMLAALKKEKVSRRRALGWTWVDLGCGAGGFLSSLKDAGGHHGVGVDADGRLLEQAARHNPGVQFVQHAGSLAQCLKQYPARVFTAFFVFEHVEDGPALIRALKGLPQGTWLAFAVPVHGFSCLLENCFPKRYARNLDAVVHTQLYTDESIRYLVQKSGFEITAQWIFGQDTLDLRRHVMGHMRGRYPEKLWNTWDEKLRAAQDQIQSALDVQSLADQRHVLAVKR
jgi:SAM-dependent methyltransferase